MFGIRHMCHPSRHFGRCIHRFLPPVPEYDVVHLRVISKRSSQNPEDIVHKQVYLNAFGKEMQLNLKPNREFSQRLPSMKLFAAETRDGDLRYVEEALGPAAMGRPYHDDDKMAAVVVRHEKDGRILLVSCNLLRSADASQRT